MKKLLTRLADWLMDFALELSREGQWDSSRAIGHHITEARTKESKVDGNHNC